MRIEEGGTWLTKAEVEGDVDESAASGEVEGGFTTTVPNRNELCQRGSHKLGARS